MKVVGRTPTALRVSERFQGPSRAREARFTCHLCQQTKYVSIPWGASAQMRSMLMTEAVEVHRRVCRVADGDIPLPLDGSVPRRTYSINYPRL